MLLLIDSYDSFTYMIRDYFLQLNEEIIVKRNDVIDKYIIDRLAPKGIIISPGPKRPEDSGNIMKIIKEYDGVLPILGICLGYQALGLHYGASLELDPEPMHGKSSSIEHTEHPLFNNIPQGFRGMRYHSLVLTGLAGTDLEVIARTKQNEPMAFVHKHNPVTGIQFHPESIGTAYGLLILKNWLAFAYAANGPDPKPERISF